MSSSAGAGACTPSLSSSCMIDLRERPDNA
jgi:hypothetical protein